MKQRNGKSKTVPGARPDDEAYAVGYGKPPADTRFKPGQSGNPRGRPKGAGNKDTAPSEAKLKDLIIEEAYRTITVNEGEKRVSMSMAKAVIRSIAVNAATGDQRAQRLFTELLDTTERRNEEEQVEFYIEAIRYKKHWEMVLAERKRLGTKGPEPFPHPDHVKIDHRRSTVEITGPMSKEEKEEEEDKRREFLLNGKAKYEKDVAELRQLLIDEPENPLRDEIGGEIKHGETILGIVRRHLGEE